MSTDKTTKIGAGEAGLSPADADPTAPASGGSLVLTPDGSEKMERALPVGSDRFDLLTSYPLTAAVSQAVHHPVLSPATLLALVGVSKKAGELFFEEALAAELTGNRPEALTLYQKAIEAWGSAFSKDKNAQIAEAYERMALLESDPSKQGRYVAQAATHWTLHAKRLLNKGKAGEAMEVLKKAITFSQKAGSHLDRVERNSLHALALMVRAAWLANKGDSGNHDDPERLRDAARLIEEITQKIRQGEDPAQLVSQAMTMATEIVPEVTRYAGQTSQGGFVHEWVDFGGMKTKFDTALFIFEAVEEWVTNPDDQIKIVTTYRMRAKLHQRMQAGTLVAFDEAKADELESQWGLVSEQRVKLIGTADPTVIAGEQIPVAILPAISSPDHAEHSSPLRDLFLKARLLNRWGKQREAAEIYLYLARQAEERGDLSSALELYQMIDLYRLDNTTTAALYEKMGRLNPDPLKRASYFERAASTLWGSGTLAGQRRAVDLIQGPARSVAHGERRMAICRDFLRSLGATLEQKGNNETADLILQASGHVDATVDPSGRVSWPDVMELGAEIVSKTTDAESSDHALWLLDGALALYSGVGGGDTRQVAATYLLRANLRRSLGLSELAEQDERNAGAEELPADDLMATATLAYTRAQALEQEEDRWIPFIGTGGHALNLANGGRRTYQRRVASILFPPVWKLVESPVLFKETPPPPLPANEEELVRRYQRALYDFYDRYVQASNPLILDMDAEYISRLETIANESYYFGKLQPNQKEALARLLAAHYVREMGISRPARNFLEAQRAYLSAPLPASSDDVAPLSPEKIYRDIQRERNRQGEILLDTRLDSLSLADPDQPDATVADLIEGTLRKEGQAPPPVWTIPVLIRLARQKLSSHGTGFRDVSNVPLSSRLVDLGISEDFEFGGGPDNFFSYLDDLSHSLEISHPSGPRETNTLQDVILAFADQLWSSRRQSSELDRFRARALTLAVEAIDERLGGGQGLGGGEKVPGAGNIDTEGKDRGGTSSMAVLPFLAALSYGDPNVEDYQPIAFDDDNPVATVEIPVEQTEVEQDVYEVTLGNKDDGLTSGLLSLHSSWGVQTSPWTAMSRAPGFATSPLARVVVR
ncbi:MAG: hypothetical protein HY541_02595, partial [Deltaproteobacteria bacterium]|nr:hypothetical protein [Deltaproteobacteria bacterium]